jgi:hypothetical protein
MEVLRLHIFVRSVKIMTKYDMCSICGLFAAEHAWFLEPKDGNFISICKLCQRDLIMIRRWRRQDKEKAEKYREVKYDGKNNLNPIEVGNK